MVSFNDYGLSQPQQAFRYRFQGREIQDFTIDTPTFGAAMVIINFTDGGTLEVPNLSENDISLQHHPNSDFVDLEIRQPGTTEDLWDAMKYADNITTAFPNKKTLKQILKK